MKPLIGITGTRFTMTNDLPGPRLLGVSLSDDYAHGVEAAGGIPMVIPFLEQPKSIADLASRLDGLLLAGGEDVDPLLYGEQPQTGLGAIVPERDWLEIELIRAMTQQEKPIFAVCRGLQILNTAFGGTLYQDLSQQWKGTGAHAQRARRSHLSHHIRIKENSKLYELLGKNESLFCNSFHHQAIKKLGNGLVATAWDDEGLIEAFEHPDYDFLIAVQWHPENLWRTTPVYFGLFQGFVEVSKRRHARERENKDLFPTN